MFSADCCTTFRSLPQCTQEGHATNRRPASSTQPLCNPDLKAFCFVWSLNSTTISVNTGERAQMMQIDPDVSCLTVALLCQWTVLVHPRIQDAFVLRCCESHSVFPANFTESLLTVSGTRAAYHPAAHEPTWTTNKLPQAWSKDIQSPFHRYRCQSRKFSEKSPLGQIIGTAKTE